MIDIKIKERSTSKFLDPCDMLGTPYGTVFQQYFKGHPEDTYYVSCGNGEKSVLTIWFDDESELFKLSTDDRESLSELVDSVRVAIVDADVKIKLLM